MVSILGVLFAILAALFPPCSAEDANLCYWDASNNANSSGVSFIAISDDFVIYQPDI